MTTTPTPADRDAGETIQLTVKETMPGRWHGWIFDNPDTGTELSDNHPVRSGECDDAKNIRPATRDALRDELLMAWRAWEEERIALAAARQEIADLREALAFYADSANWTDRRPAGDPARSLQCRSLHIVDRSQRGLTVAILDMGRRAANAFSVGRT